MKRTPNPFKKPAFKHRSQYGVVVLCKDERDQRQVYNRLLKQRLNLKVVTV